MQYCWYSYSKPLLQYCQYQLHLFYLCAGLQSDSLILLLHMPKNSTKYTSYWNKLFCSNLLMEYLIVEDNDSIKNTCNMTLPLPLNKLHCLNLTTRHLNIQYNNSISNLYNMILPSPHYKQQTETQYDQHNWQANFLSSRNMFRYWKQHSYCTCQLHLTYLNLPTKLYPKYRAMASMIA